MADKNNKKEKPVAKEKIVKEKKRLFNRKNVKEPVAQIAKPVADPFDIIRFVLMTEKSIRMVETQNKLVFIVNRPSKKPQIRQAVEQAFGSPVSHITVLMDQDGRKKAFVKFRNEGAAGDIAIKLGVI